MLRSRRSGVAGLTTNSIELVPRASAELDLTPTRWRDDEEAA